MPSDDMRPLQKTKHPGKLTFQFKFTPN